MVTHRTIAANCHFSKFGNFLIYNILLSVLNLVTDVFKSVTAQLRI